MATAEYKKSFYIMILLSGLILTACQTTTAISPERMSWNSPAASSLMQVTVTGQGYNFHRPWQQRRPGTQTALGVIVPGGRILVNGLLVANQRYIELETIDTRTKGRAEVDVVDYEANLALLKPVDPAFIAGRRGLELADDVREGDSLGIPQAKPDGDVFFGESKVTAVELSVFSLNHLFLAYRLDGALQYRGNNATLPVLKGDKLAGLVLRSGAKERTIDAISLPVIRHFLADARDGSYRGFPIAGFHFGDSKDPQLRRFIGLPDELTGIYVQKVVKGGPADRAGLRAGDVVTRFGPHKLSNIGQYDHPLYGKTSVLHLIRTEYLSGQEVPLSVFREGNITELKVVLDHRTPDRFLVPPYIVDQRPEYLIVGGLVLQELSLSYLREYGNEWATEAPIHLLFYNQTQDYLNGDKREKIVIISGVIPTPYTIGYENLANIVIDKINGVEIGRLADVNRALAAPLNGYHKFEAEQNPGVIYLDPKEIPLIHRMIEQRYRIPLGAGPRAAN
jgi:S1-C subfamily serine protease